MFGSIAVAGYHQAPHLAPARAITPPPRRGFCFATVYKQKEKAPPAGADRAIVAARAVQTAYL